ncbi:MAG TPA: class I SAM-dependent methyltransferase [Actinophytocola sp.]|uniref:THUMP-like domain-containing protein n=1 Tax=Actinophytocola sp. TaxID=1872138 RepID=UPI002DDD32A8|nr:class I SAM-dependent methyltransferase [Actinophytocola sp.]HEV2782109.1 class I SAM-dependent methyltransferase [Actinophytocola sp.]
MSYEFSLADVAFLTSPAGVAAVAQVDRLALTGASYLADVRTARGIVGDRAGAVLETVLLRRKAVSKVDDPGRWLLTDAALQQATPMPVARHRAERFAGRDVHDVTCSVGVDLAALAAVAARCLGSDLDPVRLAMARHNCAAALVRADALRPVSRGTAVFADPGRRDAAGRRRWRPSDFTPPLDALAEAYRGRDLAVKCAPGIDIPWAGEVELVSLDGQVREACLWSGSLATAGRRATVLRTGGPAWTVTDAEPDDCPVRPPGQWIVDPDGAVVRAGLVRHYAARHGLGQLDERIAYLTGDTPPPGVRAFRVLEHGHYSEKALRATLRRLGVGRLEILVRGLDIDPNTLRPRLKLGGPAEATAVLTRVGHTPTAFVCAAVRIPANFPWSERPT